jgi:hypothetical protein
MAGAIRIASKQIFILISGELRFLVWDLLRDFSSQRLTKHRRQRERLGLKVWSDWVIESLPLFRSQGENIANSGRRGYFLPI